MCIEIIVLKVDLSFSLIRSKTNFALTESPHFAYMLSSEFATGTTPDSPSFTTKEWTFFPIFRALLAEHEARTLVNVNWVGEIPEETMRRNVLIALLKRPKSLYPTIMVVQDTESGWGISPNTWRA